MTFHGGRIKTERQTASDVVHADSVAVFLPRVWIGRYSLGPGYGIWRIAEWGEPLSPSPCRRGITKERWPNRLSRSTNRMGAMHPAHPSHPSHPPHPPHPHHGHMHITNIHATPFPQQPMGALPPPHRIPSSWFGPGGAGATIPGVISTGWARFGRVARCQ